MAPTLEEVAEMLRGAISEAAIAEAGFIFAEEQVCAARRAVIRADARRAIAAQMLRETAEHHSPLTTMPEQSVTPCWKQMKRCQSHAAVAFDACVVCGGRGIEAAAAWADIQKAAGARPENS